MLASFYPVRGTRLSGQEIYTGKNFMEVVVKMEALDPDGGGETLMLGVDTPFLSSVLDSRAQGTSGYLADNQDTGGRSTFTR